MTDRPLLFQKPDFHQGVNVTVRKGAKWFGLLEVGDFVELQSAGDGDVGNYGFHLVLGIAFMKDLDDIEPELLKFEHDATCRDELGIRAELERIYGEDVDDGEGFSVIVFYYGESLTSGVRL